jgi:two-component system, OmpR family, alkaline phosphatase synthesis response regulator PhoP
MTRKRILLVDDAETILLMEKMILGKAYDLMTAKDGADAVTKAVSERPDLILLDVVMPIMSGIEVCQALKGREETKNIPIIIVTTRGEPHSIESAFKSGCTDYVVKPISNAELLKKVRKHIGD